MKTKMKRMLGLLMVLIMALGVFGCGRYPGTVSTDKLVLDIQLENSGFQWGDTLTFSVNAKNAGEVKLTNVKVDVTASDVLHFGTIEVSPEAVPDLLPGESVVFTVSCPTVASGGVLGGAQTPQVVINKASSVFSGTVYEAKIGAALSSYKLVFKPVYSESGSASTAAPTEQTGWVPTELPTQNDRFAFLDLYSDVRDVHVGENAPVTFFAQMMSEYIVGDAVNLMSDADGSILGQLHDDGIAPDEQANDGLFSGTFDLSSDARRNVSYRATCADIASRPVDICYFNDLTQADFTAVDNLLSSIQSIDNFGGVSDYLEENAEIEYCIKDADAGTITFTTNAGITCVWDSNFGSGFKGGCDSAAAQLDAAVIHGASMLASAPSVSVANNKNIAVVRPFRGSQFTYDDFKDCAEGITSELGGTVTVKDDQAADLEFLKTLDDYGIVLYDSHGTIVDYMDNGVKKTDPYLITGEISTNINDPKYSADVQARRIVLFGNNSHVAIGHKFFDYYYPNNAFDDTVFFLGTCYSMYNDTIARSLVDKGASVVFGYADTVSVTYCNNTLDETMLQSMALNKTTAGQAHANAVARYGATDPGNPKCEFKVYGMTDYRIASESGMIAGVITSSRTGEPIKRANMQVFDESGNLVREFRSDAVDGSFSEKLPEGVYSMTVSAYGYLFRRVSNIVVTAGEITYISDSVMLDPDGASAAGGYVINTFTGEYVSGAVIKFRSGHGNRTGDYVQVDGAEFTLVSDENGEFYTDKLKPGYYTAEVVCEGYITAYVDVVSATEAVDQALPLTPSILADQIRIVLTWGEYPYDLDSHLVGPRASGSGRFHTSFIDRTYSYNGTTYADLDRDDTDSYGPEQTTVYKKTGGTYRYYVHDYSNRNSASSTAMARSGAKVVVYFGESVREFNVPSTSEGTLWHVFDFSFDTGILTPVNTMSYHSNPETVGE